ncbi:MAG: IPT/TIG domain-containing protein [Bradymonadales bacterium]|nr:IPT/TIG domain-containing protein [Bradymonadales bacterium]
MAAALAAAWMILSTVSGCGDDTSPTADQDASDSTGEPEEDLSPTDAPQDFDRAPDSQPPDQTGDFVASDADLDEVIRPDIPIQDAQQEDMTTVEPAMEIRSISPERGPTSGQTTILIVGLGFTADTDIYLGGALCQNIDFVDETKIICSTPPNAAGTYHVKAVNNREEYTLENGFTYFAPIRLDSLDPARGPSRGGMPSTARGEGFTSSTQLSIGGRMAMAIEVVDSGTVRFLTPPGEPGPARVQLSSENGLASLEEGFEYYDPIEITRLLPAAGLAAGGEEVRIAGLGFTTIEDLEVRFGLLTAEIQSVGSREITVTVPPGPPDSTVDVTVSSQTAGAFTRADGFYYFGEASGLALYLVSPNRGSTAGGTTVVLSGTGLSQVTQVTIGGAAATLQDLTEFHDSYRIARTPPSTAGPADVVVETATGSYTLADGFTYLPAIDVTAIGPDRGDIAGGTPVTLTGTGFTAGTSVTIGALQAADVQVLTSTTISAVTSPGALGPADVVVRTPEGVEDTLPKGFTYTAQGQIFGITPLRGSMAGGTYVIVRGAGFFEPVQILFGGELAYEVTLLDSATLAVRTPPHSEGYVTVSAILDDGQVLTSPERFLYYDPLSIVGGVWGEEVLGAVNVTVLSDNGSPLAGAFVMLNVREDSPHTGTTDANGQVTLSGPDLSGEQTVTATRTGFSSSTVEAVNAENITVVLSCVPEGQCFSNSDCRPGFVCMCGPPYGFVGTCVVEPECGFEITSQEQFEQVCSMSYDPTPFGVITGNLTGVHKVDDPGPTERIVGAVFTTQPHPFQRSPIDPGSGNTMPDDGPYTLRSRIGEVALVALCGLYDDETNVFYPSYMGVKRGLFIVDGQTYTVDMECNIRLDQTISVKSLFAPFTPNGPDHYLHRPYLHFGSEGYFGGVVTIEGTADVLSNDRFAPLTGELAGLSYYIQGGAFTGSSWPYSYTVRPGVTNLQELVVLPAFVPVPYLITPADGGMLLERYFEWSMSTDVRPDFYYILIYDFYQTIYWEVVVPGDQTWFNLPDWPQDAPVGLLPSGTLLMQIMAIDAINFDYDQFTFNDLSITSWNGYSLNVFLFNVP